MTSAFEFVRQVKQEASRVTWPTRKETTVTTIMVFIMVMLASFFFLGVDAVVGRIIKFILGLGN